MCIDGLTKLNQERFRLAFFAEAAEQVKRSLHFDKCYLRARMDPWTYGLQSNIPARCKHVNCTSS